VCVLQSCLGLIDLGYQVFVVEEAIFSSARNTAAAKARLQAEGVVLLSYKTLYFELLEAVGVSRHTDKLIKTFGPFPDDLPEVASDGPPRRRRPAGSLNPVSSPLLLSPWPSARYRRPRTWRRRPASSAVAARRRGRPAVS